MELLTLENGLALLTLTILEIVLGIDNVIFIAIIVSKLPKETQAFVRKTGLLLAMFLRIVLLYAISWIMLLTEPLFFILAEGFSGRDIILTVGGLFLIAKSTHEIHQDVEGGGIEEEKKSIKKATTLGGAMFQIILIDLVFSLDSVITAVGMAKEFAVMATAIIIAVGVMMVFAKRIGDFIEEHPTFKMLALSFILMIGVMLVVEGCGGHIDKGYIYFAMGFSLLVEVLNTRAQRTSTLKSL